MGIAGARVTAKQVSTNHKLFMMAPPTSKSGEVRYAL